jgi:hypothetical protein
MAGAWPAAVPTRARAPVGVGGVGVVCAVGRLHPTLGLVVHHEVHVRAFHLERVDGLPVGASPRLQRVRVLRVGIDAGDHHRIGRVARWPRRGVLYDAPHGTVDRVQVHEAERARRLRRLRDVHVDCIVRSATSRSHPSSTTARPSGRTDRTACRLPAWASCRSGRTAAPAAAPPAASSSSRRTCGGPREPGPGRQCAKSSIVHSTLIDARMPRRMAHPSCSAGVPSAVRPVPAVPESPVDRKPHMASA